MENPTPKKHRTKAKETKQEAFLPSSLEIDELLGFVAKLHTDLADEEIESSEENTS